MLKVTSFSTLFTGVRESNGMKILWFTWKDKNHPQSGGAETVNEELAKRLARDGHEVIFLVGGFPGGKYEEMRDGFKIIRLGNCWTVYWKAFRYYKKHLQGWADIVIDEVNTMPFFTRFYTREKRYYLFYQLCREIWFYQMKFPLNWIGYIVEPLYLRLLANDEKTVFTESESAKTDLSQYGFKKEKTVVFSIGIEIKPVDNIELVKKYANPTVLSLGAFREMKRTLDQVRAFEVAKKKLPHLQMKIAGDASGAYGRKVLRYIERSPYKDSIEYLGRVSQEEKRQLMQKSHCILVTSIKEGWGLIVTEANSQGTPAVAYNADGLRDSVRDGETGIIVKKDTPKVLGDDICDMLSDSKKYATLRENAWCHSQTFSFEKGYKTFIKHLT